MYYSPEEAVILVTSNTHDFCDGDTLAASLQDDLVRHHLGASVTVVSSLEEFNAAHVLPKLERREELRATLQTGIGGPLDLYAWAVAELPGLLRNEEYLIVATHGLEPKHAHVYASAVDSIDELTVIDARTLSAAQHLVIAKARVGAVLSVDVDGDQYAQYRESRDLVGDFLEPSASASWHETASLKVRFSLVLSAGDSRVVAAEIDAVEGQGGEYEINEVPF